MRNKVIFIIAGIGVLFGVASAFFYSRQAPAQLPVFSPAANPYGKGIYAEGIVESFQAHGENVNIYSEVSGAVSGIAVSEGQTVHKGDPILTLEDSVQRATVEQLRAQAEAAQTQLDELRAEPRKENLAIAQAQVDLAAANLKTALDSFDKLNRSFQIDPKSVSREALDTASNSVQSARQSLQLAQTQFDLTKAGAWIYDIRNQEKQCQALTKAYESANALLEKYTVRAPVDGVVLAVAVAVGGYISSTQGSYDSYTQSTTPPVVMGEAQDMLAVRVFVDEILLHGLPDLTRTKAQMFVRGTDISVPLEFVRVQPYVSPKIELSDQRTERVDVRVLPLIFKFQNSKKAGIYPGQLVDVYVGEPAEGKS